MRCKDRASTGDEARDLWSADPWVVSLDTDFHYGMRIFHMIARADSTREVVLLVTVDIIMVL